MKLPSADSFHPWVIAVAGTNCESWVQSFLSKLRETWRVGFLLLDAATEGNLLQRRAPFGDDELLLIAGLVQSPLIRLHYEALKDESHSDALSSPNDQVFWQAKVTDEVATSRASDDSEMPCFNPQDLDGLVAAIGKVLTVRMAQTPLCGLILAGGYSRRMQSDKAMLNYHGHSQLRQTYELLKPFCKQVLISCRQSQAEQDWPLDPALPPLPWLYDRFRDLGPTGGILTAMMAHPQAAFWVVAVDLPLLNAATLSHLLQARHPLRNATAFLSSHDGLPEPLCAIYEPRIRERLFAYLGLGIHCPRKVLLQSAIHTLALPEPFRLDNANTPSDYAKISLGMVSSHGPHSQSELDSQTFPD